MLSNTKIAVRLTVGLLLISAIGFGLTGRAHGTSPATTERDSLASDGSQSNGPTILGSDHSVISADGRYVVFESQATNLVAGNPTLGTKSVYLHDRLTGATSLVSTGSRDAVISSDGSHIAYTLDRADANGDPGVFIYNISTGLSIRVDVATNGGSSNRGASVPNISADGRYVSFGSLSTNLVSGDTNNVSDVFMKDLVNNTTTLISVASDGAQANSSSASSTISADGRYVTFATTASNLVPNTNGKLQGYLHDNLAGSTELVTLGNDGSIANASSSAFLATNSGGRYILITSLATNLVQGTSDNTQHVYVRDRQLGTTEVIDHLTGGNSVSQTISADGRYVGFGTLDSTIVPGDTNSRTDVFIYDRQLHTYERVSVSNNGAQLNNTTNQIDVGAAGRYVVFSSQATNAVPNDTNGFQDVFVRDRGVSDTIPPVINYSISPQPNNDGWNNSDVTVTFNCSDADSGVASCSSPVSLTNEGANQTVTGTATDNSGNAATTTATVNIDKTAPVISYTVDPAPNSNGWNNGDVTVTFNCSDTLSGIKSCTDPVTISSDGANQTLTGTATDKAGNTSTATATVSVDKTSPTITYELTPTPNSNNWNSGDVTVSFNCSDALSGIASCSDPVTVSTEGFFQTITGTATDSAGNISSVVATVNMDKTAPAINYTLSPVPNSNGWTNGNVVVSFDCSDSLSGIASCSDPVTLNTEGSNQTVTGTAVDNAGNTSSVTASVNIDKTDPTISYSLAPVSNSNGWNNGDVTVTFTCNDALSGVASCTSPVTLSTEGADQTVTGTATDKAGNTSTATATISIDKTAPTIIGSATPAANSNGWNNGNVTVSFICSDSGSGIVMCPNPVTVTEGGGQIITGTTTDKAGNSASTSVMVNVDKTAPTISYTVSPTPNSNGWNNGNVTVTFNCSDALSGVASCSNPVTLTTGGANQAVTGIATDTAGNSSTVTATVNVDKTAPTINYTVTPVPNSNGWNNGNVVVSFTCSDSGSGISVCPGSVTLAEGGGQILTGTATDNAGNTASASVMVNVDKTAPTISYSVAPAANSNGWNNGNVTVTFNCSDALSGIATCSSPITLSTEGANQTVTGTATDLAGNSRSVTASVSIDKTAPVVTALTWITNPLQQGQNTTLSSTVTDSLSGVNNVRYSIDGGTPQTMSYDSASGTWKATFGSTLAVNTYNVTVTASDTAGNTSAGTTDVLAVYTNSNGYVTGHARILPTAGVDTLPIALDVSNTTKLVLGFSNVTSPASGSFDLDYSVNKKPSERNEFSLSSTSINWVVIQDSHHASTLGHADMTTYVNGARTDTQNVAVRIDITLGINVPDHASIKIFNPGVDPNTGIPAYTISDDVSNGSNLMIHP